MNPPMGLKANVLSATTVVLTWSDSSLGRNQRVNDNRYYSVRYNPKMSRKKKTVNSTDLNAHIDDLKPNTEYEFAVRVIKGLRNSGWSMSTFATTDEAGITSWHDNWGQMICNFTQLKLSAFVSLSKR